MNDPRDFRSFTIRANTAEKGEQLYECTPENTILYLYDPDEWYDYDHFFRQLSGDELPEEYQNTGRMIGGFITRHVLGDEAFDEYADLVTNSCNYKVVYEPAPTETDRQAIDDQMADILQRELDNMSIEDFLDD